MKHAEPDSRHFSQDRQAIYAPTGYLYYRVTMDAAEPVAKKRKRTSPCDPWKRQMYAEFLDGEHRITVLAAKYGHAFRVVKNAIASERAAVAGMTADVETSLGRYLSRLRYAEVLAEELHATSTGNARASALKSIVMIAEKVASASGVATVREAAEVEKTEDLLRRLIEPSMAKMPLNHRN